MKFFILSHQRAGTHLLATLLNSHPDITMYDEIYSAGVNPVLPLKKNRKIEDGEGFIWMYNQIINRRELIKGFKVIHLVRDLRENAISYWMLQNKKKLGMVAHYTDKPNFDRTLKPTEEQIDKRIKLIKARQKLALQLVDCPILEVNYEYLTKNKSVSELSKEKAKPICDFLEIEPRKLITNLVKSRQ